MEENKQKEKACPLCQVDDETVKSLKQSGQSKKTEATKKKPFYSSRWFIALICIVLIALTIFAFKLINNLGWTFSSGESSLLIVLEEEMVYAPEFILEDIDGNEVSSSDFLGRNTLLVFWATWCGWCRKELPDLKDFAEEYKDQIKVLAIVSGESEELVREYAIQEEINFQVLLDDNYIVREDYGVRGTPSHFLIGSEGKIIASRPGYTSKDGLEMMASMITITKE